MDKLTVIASGELVSYKNDSSSYQHVDYSSIDGSNFVNNIGHQYLHETSEIGVTDYSNEFFIQYYVPQQEWRRIAKSYEETVDSSGSSINELLWNDLNRKSESTTKGEASSVLKNLNVTFFIKLLFSIIAVFLITLFRKILRKRKTLRPRSNFCIVRSKASEQKLNAIKDKFNLSIAHEDIVFRTASMPSMFSYLSFSDIFKSLPYLFKESLKDSLLISQELGILFGEEVKFAIMGKYHSRVVLKVFYEYAISTIIRRNNVSKIYTGNKEDRFAMVEKRVAKSANIKLVCIPHGLEYGFHFPGGVAGDKFYCTSQNTVKLFNRIYPSIEPVFSYELQSKLYSLTSKTAVDISRKIVFFTESRDIEVNRKIILGLSNSGISFSLRLHPKDNKSNYSDFSGLKYEKSYIESISNVICLARKSTVLIEALFNNSLPVAFVENSKDFYYVTSVFPSLSDNSIIKCRDNAEFIQFLKNIKG